MGFERGPQASEVALPSPSLRMGHLWAFIVLRTQRPHPKSAATLRTPLPLAAPPVSSVWIGERNGEGAVTLAVALKTFVITLCRRV
jgi:hypothetical protein